VCTAFRLARKRHSRELEERTPRGKEEGFTKGGPSPQASKTRSHQKKSPRSENKILRVRHSTPEKKEENGDGKRPSPVHTLWTDNESSAKTDRKVGLFCGESGD